MSRPNRRPPSRTARRVAIVGALVATLATLATLLLAAGAQGDGTRTRAQLDRLAKAKSARAALDRAAETTPLAVNGRCVRTAIVYGQGRSCRLPDGMYLVPQADGPALVTHGPDIVDTTSRAARDGGFGTTGSYICSPPSTTRHVVLLYLLPSDFAAGTSLVHGDRYATVADQLRQAFYDASEVIDRRAQQLAGQRRRVRVLCDDDGRPTVLRVVLPRTAQEYVSSRIGGFQELGLDLEKLGHAPRYSSFDEMRLPSVRRLLGYYDAEFSGGLAGQGTMYPRASMLGQGVRASDPLVSRTTRNVSNNPPKATLAVQYANSSFVGDTQVPDPPLYTSLLHELSHTMGAVQDELATASLNGHCIDGLDVMCYDDGSSRTYSSTVCPDPAPPFSQDDEVYDCNGDTYFHPSPPAGSPLNGSTVWHLGLPANQTLGSTTTPRPAAVSGVASSGVGTRRTVRWNAVPGAIGYEVAARTGSRAWEYTFTRTTSAVPMLRPSSRYELRVTAVGSGQVAGPGARIVLRTGLDNTPPLLPTRVSTFFVLRTSVMLQFTVPADNVRTTRFRVERRVGTRWVPHVTLSMPRGAVAGGRVVPTIGGLSAGRRYTLRLRGIDGRGNVSLPSRAVSFTTRR